MIPRLNFISLVLKGNNSVLCQELKNPSRYGVVKIDNNNLITSLMKREKLRESIFPINTAHILLKRKKLFLSIKINFH